MEITEHWVGKAAGGRVLKEARNLVRLGKVIKVIEKNGVFQGELSSGKRPLKVVVKVLGPVEVKNLCPCSHARATGAMCEHAAALIIAGVQKKDLEKEAKVPKAPPKSNTPQPTLVPLEVRFSPKFPYEGVRSVHLRRVKEKETIEPDYTLGAWLVQNTGKVDAAMLALPEAKVGSFYRSVSGHTRLKKGDDLMTIESGSIRPMLELEVDKEGGEMIWLRLADGQDGMVKLGDSLAEWNEEAFNLTVATVSGSGLAELIAIDDLLVGEWLQVEISEFIRSQSSWVNAFQLPEGLGGLVVKEAVPVIELEIAGSSRNLQAQLTAVYEGKDRQIRIALGNVKAQLVDESFPIASSIDHEWLVRNIEAEREAVVKFMRTGFESLDASGLLFLRGEDEAMEFLTTSLPLLRKEWLVKTEEKLVNVEARLGRIVPNIEIETSDQISGSGTDWLACDVSWQCGDQVLDRDAVRRLLQSGNRTMSLPNGKKAVISHFDAEVMDGFMLDTDPKQENGKFHFPARQSAYVERLRSYYGDEVVEKEQAVPALPDDLEQTVREYQKEGIQWLYRRALTEGGALLADDMGLGKTLQSLAFIKLWKEHGGEDAAAPALVVCPATLLGNWRDEAAKFVPDLSVLVMHGARRKNDFELMGAADIIITSYALLDKDCKHYQEMKLGAILLDEASAIRNPDTLAAKAARKVNAAMKIAITGTPVENSVRDLWSIFQFVMPGYLGSREDFKLRYEQPCSGEVPDRAAIQRLRWRTSPFMLRRTKSLVAKDLPPKIESIIWCDPSAMQKEHYDGILRHGAEKVDDLMKQSGAGGARMQMLTVLLRLRQSCCDLRLLDKDLEKTSLADVSSKLTRLMELLSEAKRGGHRVLVFSQFTTMLSLICDELDSADMDYCYLDGSTRDRSAVVDRFQKEDGPDVFLISLKAGGYGLTLTAADTVVLFDPWWNPAVEAQAADRIHRIGQTKPSTIYKFITRGTVEEKILTLQQKKLSVINAATGDIADESSPMMGGLSEGELLSLLEV
ncbi:SNF2 family helicase [Akkermansiaceae bacterium]|nr:SNF2 family helicase [Akkermansiaceae bacterium]